MKSTKKIQRSKPKKKKKKNEINGKRTEKKGDTKIRNRRKQQNPNMCFLVFAYTNKSFMFTFQFSLRFGEKKNIW